MSETIDVIYLKCEPRKYKPIPLNRKTLDELISAGKIVPSAMSRLPWEFYILTDKEKTTTFYRDIKLLALKKIRQADFSKTMKPTLSIFYFSSLVNFLKNKDCVFYGPPAVIFIIQPLNDNWGFLGNWNVHYSKHNVRCSLNWTGYPSN